MRRQGLALITLIAVLTCGVGSALAASPPEYQGSMWFQAITGPSDPEEILLDGPVE